MHTGASTLLIVRASSQVAGVGNSIPFTSAPQGVRRISCTAENIIRILVSRVVFLTSWWYKGAISKPENGHGRLEMGVDAITNANSGTGDRKRVRSTVKFPYSDLNTAIELAAKIKEKAGVECDTTQLAAWMGQSPTGGTFRSRYSAARLFGLITSERTGTVNLTELGQDVLDAQESGKAKTTAFLNIDLFRRIYETHKGRTLPPPQALERMMATLGVTPKQVERARQTFVSSAEVAQFIDPHTGVFVRPGFPSDGKNGFDNTTVSAESKDEPSKGGGNDDGAPPPGLDPIIVGLLSRLPKSGDVWPAGERKLWLDLLEGSFKLIYKEPKEDDQRATITDETT